MGGRAVFLDKDGTLIEDSPYSADPNQIRLKSRAIEGLVHLQQEGYRLLIVSNQSGIARGYLTEMDLAEVAAVLRRMLREAGVFLARFYWCPHHPDGLVPEYAIACGCRKPQPGMLQWAARDNDIDLVDSWMIGDTLDDVEAGHRAGCRTILLASDPVTESPVSPLRQPHRVAADLVEAAAWISRACSLRGDL